MSQYEVECPDCGKKFSIALPKPTEAKSEAAKSEEKKEEKKSKTAPFWWLIIIGIILYIVISNLIK